MSLPAGALITSIGGKRCTAIPRVAALNNSFTISSSITPTSAALPTAIAATSSTTVAAVNLPTVASLFVSPTPIIAVASSAADSAISQSSTTLLALPTSTQLSAPILLSTPIRDSTQATIVSTNAPPPDPEVAVAPTISPATSAPTTTATFPNGLVPSASPVVAQSQASMPVTRTSESISYSQVVASTIGYNSPTRAGESPTHTSTALAASASSNMKTIVGSVMGSIVGGVALIGIFLFLWWRHVKRKKLHNSLISPLNSGFPYRQQREKYEFDGGSLGPTTLGERWMAAAGGFCLSLRMDLVDFGSSIIAKFSRNYNAPSVDMNRGNSQFFEPVQQHSRTNSAASGGCKDVLTTRDRLGNWWQHFIKDIHFNWRLRQKANGPIDNFAVIRGVSEKRVSSNFSQVHVMKDHELRRASERHRRSQSTAALPPLGSLGLEFDYTSNPFADPFPTTQPTISNIPEPAATLNPFADPKDVNRAMASKPNSSNYISNVRRSRGISQPVPKHSAPAPATQLPSDNVTNPFTASRYSSTAVATTPSSRYPSTVLTSQDRYRDTVLSTVSISRQKDKYRSDPFDLDRPELRYPPEISSSSQAESTRNSGAERTSTGAVKMQPRIESVYARMPKMPSNAETASGSNYSSRFSAMFGEWGGPGPDLGPFSRGVGPEEGIIGSNEATRGIANSESGWINYGRAL